MLCTLSNTRTAEKGRCAAVCGLESEAASGLRACCLWFGVEAVTIGDAAALADFAADGVLGGLSPAAPCCLCTQEGITTESRPSACKDWAPAHVIIFGEAIPGWRLRASRVPVWRLQALKLSLTRMGTACTEAAGCRRRTTT